MTAEETAEGTNPFGHLGVRTAINAVGPATRMGGVPLHPVVVNAMARASVGSVRMDELAEAAGARIADLLGVEASYVTSGATAALTIASSIAITQGQPDLLDILPHAESEVVILASHRDPYDRAVEAAGARIVSVGYPKATHLGEVERAFSARTAAVVYRPQEHQGPHPSLRAIARVAHDRGIPVIVDGALYGLPPERLQRLIEDGADFVALSGGKHLRGPQATGLLCGRREWLSLASLPHQDMDERETSWPRQGLPSAHPTTPPRHGIARAMKVGPEQIMGLVAAVERYVTAPGQDDEPGIRELLDAQAVLVEGRVDVSLRDSAALCVPVLAVKVAASDADRVIRALQHGSPRIFVEEGDAWDGVLLVNPMGLRPGDGQTLGRALAALLGDQRSSADEKKETEHAR